MKRRILLTCEDYFPHVGGAEVCVYNLRKQLTALGYEATVFTNTMERTQDEDHVIRFPWSFSLRGIYGNITTLWSLIKASDLVHCTYSFRIACLCAVIARLQGKPMLLTQQGRGIVPESHPRWMDAVLVRICQHVSMRLCHHITSTSDEITDLTAAFVPRSKITLVSNGYDAERFTPNTSIPCPQDFTVSPGTKRLLTVRRLVPKNGIHILVQALGLVLKKRSDFHYFAIGEGRTQAFVESLVQKHGLTGHVTLLGKRSNDQILPYYQHTDLVLVPSSAEARSIACIEAMAMGKPLIASRVGGLIDLLGSDSAYGELVSIYDSEACTYTPPDTLPEDRLQNLADAILAFLDSPDPLLAKAAKASDLVRKQYSWASITQEYIRLYDRLLQRRS